MLSVDFARHRVAMVEDQIAGRGVRANDVLEAMRAVPREVFLPAPLQEFAYEDAALPIDQERSIPQPYLVAIMAEALAIGQHARVLEIGTGSGYATAVLCRLARKVYSVEWNAALAAKAAAVLRKLRCPHVQIVHADASLGLPAEAPFDAIFVNPDGAQFVGALKAQLAVGGRMVVSAGTDPAVRELVRLTRTGPDAYVIEDIADVRVAPLNVDAARYRARREGQRPPGSADAILAQSIAGACERFETVDSADLAPLLDRIGDARVVLLGEATHGSCEFYRMRERISRELIERRHFDFVAIEGDWPDAARIDRYVRHAAHRPARWSAFARFPAWMWRNREVRTFVEWLRARNEETAGSDRVAFHGLDLYSLYNSIHSVVGYLEDVDPDTAQIARRRYGCLTPWQSDPANYGHAALNAQYRSCEREVVSMLEDLLLSEHRYAAQDGERFLDAVQNARLVANAERYYRTMYYGSRASWNLRDSHMFETLQSLLAHHGAQSKAIVWAHNSHVGDARATEMSRRGEHNIGQLCRVAFGSQARLVGFGTHTGTVAAASDWDAGRCRSMRCVNRWPEAMSAFATNRRSRTSSCRCDGRRPRRWWRVCRSRGWSARSAFSTGPRPSAKATTSRPSCRASSTSTSGSTRRAPSRPWRPRRSKACRRPTPSACERSVQMSHPSSIVIGPHRLEGELCLVHPPRGIVIFAHGSGSSRHSRRNIQVARALGLRGLSTLLFDLLTSDEVESRANVFDIPLLAQRVLDALDAVSSQGRQPVGLFGASTGAAAALVAAARRPQAVQAVVSRGGRPDLAGESLGAVLAPTLLIVGGADTEVLALNRAALGLLRCEKQLEVVARATHLFEEAGALEVVSGLACAWFLKHLHASDGSRSGSRVR